MPCYALLSPATHCYALMSPAYALLRLCEAR